MLCGALPTIALPHRYIQSSFTLLPTLAMGAGMPRSSFNNRTWRSIDANSVPLIR